MKKLILLMMIIVPIIGFSQSRKNKKKADKETIEWRYEIENAGTATQGNCNVKVWSYSKDPRVATEQSKKNAIHGVVFKGVPDADRIKGKKALVNSSIVEENSVEFFSKFFATGGDYMRYVAITTTGKVGAGDVIKLKRKSYKVGVIVTVQYDALRKRLEQEGVIKSLGGRF